MKKCTIIGISDSRDQWFKPEIEKIIANGKIFSGGLRHREIMKDTLPLNSKWIEITVPLQNAFEEYKKHEDVIVFASGDPLFYGIGTTIKNNFSESEIIIYPCFNSLQMLAHKLGISYQEMRVVSLTGRSWEKFDEALIRGEKLIGCLTDHNKTPNVIYERMLDYGYDNYKMIVGERLGNIAHERVSEFSKSMNYDTPNCLFLIKYSNKPKRFGIADNEFELLNGRQKMITKMPIRLNTLSALELGSKENFWDIGFCTGSISIEAKLMFPELKITAFEVRKECDELITKNSRKFGAPGIDHIICDFNDFDINTLSEPDAVFIGGHGGRLNEIINKTCGRLKKNGCIVFNSVSEDSKHTFEEVTTCNGMSCKIIHTITVDENNPITIMKAQW